MPDPTCPGPARGGADDAGAGVPCRPEDVPVVVDEGQLRAILAAGRPAATQGTSPDGRHVVFVHGLGHDAWDFGPLMARLPDGVTGHAVDLPGFGGHAALLAALARPEAFAGLALLAPGGLVEVPAPTQAVLRRYYAVDAILGRGDDEIVANSRRIFARPHPLSDALAARKLAWHRAPPDARQRFAVPFSTVIDDVFARPVRRDVHRLRGRLPLLSIFGAGDVVVPLASGRALEDAAGARLVILDRVGHCPHLEDPDATARLVFDFVRATFDAAPRAS